MKKKDAKSFTIEELRRDMTVVSEPRYRAEQIFSWLYKRRISSFDSMTTLPCRFRKKLDGLYYLSSFKLIKTHRSQDGTEKFLFELSDGNRIESVLIYSGARSTLCLSTQIGCKYACVFCASGLKGFIRNLKPSEILDQILFIEHKTKHKITNFVFMGMGEPLDNLENLTKVIKIMNYRGGLDIGARRITVSTCGIIPGIEKLSKLALQINLSISLHAVNDRLRNELMPVNRKYPLKQLIVACKKFIKERKRKITFEYILIKDKNDCLQDAELLSSLARGLEAKVNLIPFSRVYGSEFQTPSSQKVALFKSWLVAKGIRATVRDSKGSDIQAACGQLTLTP